jgi:hypothetical protein
MSKFSILVMYILLFSPITWQQQMLSKLVVILPKDKSNLCITLFKIEVLLLSPSHSLKEFIIIGSDIKISKFTMD